MKIPGELSLIALIGLLGAGCGGHPDAELGTPEQAAAMHVGTLEDGTEYLTDGTGRALYLLEGEPQGRSVCYDGCAEVWPPFLTPEGAPAAGEEAVQAHLVGTLTREDGTTQVTYRGQPLYYYHLDQAPDDVRGQDREDAWGEWYLVQPSGDPVREHTEEAGSSHP